MVGLRAKRPHFTEKWLRFTLHFVAHFYSARNIVIAQRGGLAFHGAFSFRGLTGYRGRRFRAFCRFCGVRSTTSGPECHRCREFVALPRWIKKRRLESGGHGSRSSKENEENRRDRVSTRRSVPLAGRSAVIQSAFWRRTQGNGCPGDRERLWMPAARRAPLPPCRRSRSRSPITDDVFAAAGKSLQGHIWILGDAMVIWMMTKM